MGLRAQAGKTGALRNAHSCLPIASSPSIPLPPSARWEAGAGPGAPLRRVGGGVLRGICPSSLGALIRRLGPPTSL